MPTKSKKRAAGDKRLDRPFDSAVLSRARKLAEKYRIVLEPHEQVGFIGSSLELPNVYADAKTADECVAAVREALTGAVAYLIESHQVPPAPAAEQIRNRQMNVRLTEAEQLRLKEAARAGGFSDTSEYIRSRLLSA